MTACPRCGEALPAEADVCRHCLHVVDRDAWQQHDAGRLGADDRGGGRPLDDPPVGPIPLAGVGGGGFASALRLFGATMLARPRRRRRSRSSRPT
jgi:hypothetical protein